MNKETYKSRWVLKKSIILYTVYKANYARHDNPQKIFTLGGTIHDSLGYETEVG